MPQTSDERDALEWARSARRGEFTRAWEASERILRRHAARPDFSKPRHQQSVWTGEPLDGRRVLVRCYHGLGDTIQFARYLPHVRAIAREVIVWAPAPLLPILASVPGADRLCPLHDGSPEIDYDVDVEVMELAFLFRSTLETIPREIPYISAPARPLPGPRPRVGLAWRCSDWEHRRSMPFAALRPLLDLDRFTWCSMQQRPRPDERHPRLFDISDGDLFDAACRVASLDMMITIDSMPAHLAGALGIPVWTLLLKDADWRWMERRDDSPWYPTMRLFRQARDGDWAGVVDRVRKALRGAF